MGVDVINNEKAIENIAMHWKVTDNDNQQTILTNDNTQQQICLVDTASAPDTIKHWQPSTVVIQCGAEKLLNQMKSALSPTNMTDVYGCSVSFAWSALFYFSPLWPSSVLLSALSAVGLIGLNGTFLYRTFLHPQDSALKKVFGATRKSQSNLVLGDWLMEDYDERLNQVQYFDEMSAEQQGIAVLGVGDALTMGSERGIAKNREQGTFDEFMGNVKRLGSATNLHQKNLPSLTIDDVTGEWMKSYRDAVNNRRIDLLAQVLNNCEGDKILMSVDDVDN